MDYTAHLVWDPEAAVWVATSEDIQGLVLESGSVDALIERVRHAVPELLELNHQPAVTSIRFQIERIERITG